MIDESEYSLVPNGELGYFTREPDGVSGMTVTALAEFCGTEQPVITNLLNKIRDSNPISNDLEDCLKSYAGKDWRLISNDPQGRLIIVDDVCQAVLEYYAFDARAYRGKEVAKDNFRVIARAGMRLFIWSKTGYIPLELRKTETKLTRGTYWYKRLGIALSDADKPLQAGYFCVYLEMMRFFNELEMRFDYVIDDIDSETGKHLVPDISIGRKFNEWLRSEDEVAYEARRRFLKSGHPIDFREAYKDRPCGSNYYEIVFYNHVYPAESHGQYNIQPARSYPNEYKSIFHYYLEEYWIPDYCLPYLQKRDPQGIEQIRETLAIMPEKTKNALRGTLVGRLIFALPPAK